MALTLWESEHWLKINSGMIGDGSGPALLLETDRIC